MHQIAFKLLFEGNWLFCNITESGCFLMPLSRTKIPNNHLLKSVRKSNFPQIHCRTQGRYFGSNECVSFPIHILIKLVIINKHDIYLYGKLSTKLLVQAANKNTKFMSCLQVTVRKIFKKKRHSQSLI